MAVGACLRFFPPSGEVVASTLDVSFFDNAMQNVSYIVPYEFRRVRRILTKFWCSRFWFGLATTCSLMFVLSLLWLLGWCLLLVHCA